MNLKYLRTLSLGDALNEIGEALAQPGADKNALNELVNQLMKDEDHYEDQELGHAWEEQYRAGRGD